MATKSKTLRVGICLYGTHEHGAGWLAYREGNTEILGNGELDPRRTFTESLWQAQDALREAGVRGRVRMQVFASNGLFYAEYEGPIERTLPYFGDLEWKAICQRA